MCFNCFVYVLFDLKEISYNCLKVVFIWFGVWNKGNKIWFILILVIKCDCVEIIKFWNMDSYNNIVD